MESWEGRRGSNRRAVSGEGVGGEGPQRELAEERRESEGGREDETERERGGRKQCKQQRKATAAQTCSKTRKKYRVGAEDLSCPVCHRQVDAE